MKRGTVLMLVAGMAVSTVLLGLMTAFVPQNLGTEVRRQVSDTVATLCADDMPEDILPHGNGIRQWAVRGRVFTQEAVGPIEVFGTASPCDESSRASSSPVRATPKARIVDFEDSGVRLATGEVVVAYEGDAQGVLTPLFAADDSLALLVANGPRQYGDALDPSGRPWRWGEGASLVARQVPGSPAVALAALRRRMERRAVETFVTTEKAQPGTAGTFRQIVEQCANRYRLSTALVYAIIHSESNFSTTLVSNRSAMGLMQILPGTASGEIHRFLHGRSGEVGFSQLRNPEVNISYGTAYLHILQSRYFGNVTDPLSREYCTVAAYNMGPNRLLRFYGPDNARAVERINAMTPDELYQDLVTRLPHRETRAYVARVRQMKTQYAALHR